MNFSEKNKNKSEKITSWYLIGEYISVFSNNPH